MVKSDVGVLTSPGQSIMFPPAASLLLRVSVLCRLMLHTALT